MQNSWRAEQSGRNQMICQVGHVSEEVPSQARQHHGANNHENQ